MSKQVDSGQAAVPDEEQGYVDYAEILGVTQTAKPGEVRNAYRRRMKALIGEIARVEITEQRRAHYLLEMAKLNASLYLLRDQDKRDVFYEKRRALIALEKEWRDADAAGSEEADALRRLYDRDIRDFLAVYVEELMLECGRDKECVEASNWNEAHERHASRILRHYRQTLFQQILQRLPFAEVTRPQVDWDERARFVSAILAGEES
jgi:hypothetical protein